MICSLHRIKDRELLCQLLHLGQRGALLELQVLELLDLVLLPEEDVVFVLDLYCLQPAELQLLLNILTHEAQLPVKLLQAAPNQQITTGLPNQTADENEGECILHVMPGNGRVQCFDIPGADLKFQVQCKSVQGERGTWCFACHDGLEHRHD